MAERKEVDVILLDDCPPNSNRSKAKAKKTVVEERKEIKRVVKGNVKKKKRSVGARVKESLELDDTESVGEYILYDVLIPSFKDTLFEMIRSGVEMFLFGGSDRDRRDRTYRDRGKSYVSYSNYYKDRDRRDYEPRRKSNRQARHDFDDIVIENRREAESVLVELADIVDEYGEASVADFYSLVGISADYTDRKWGWDNISNAYVERTRDGYVVRLPKTIVLE